MNAETVQLLMTGAAQTIPIVVAVVGIGVRAIRNQKMSAADLRAELRDFRKEVRDDRKQNEKRHGELLALREADRALRESDRKENAERHGELLALREADRKENAERHGEMMNLLRRLGERTAFLEGRADAKREDRGSDATVGAEGSARAEGREEALAS